MSTQSAVVASLTWAVANVILVVVAACGALGPGTAYTFLFLAIGNAVGVPVALLWHPATIAVFGRLFVAGLLGLLSGLNYWAATAASAAC